MSPFLQFLAGVLASALTVGGVWYTARTSARTTREGTQVEAGRAQFDQLQEEIERLGKRVAELDAKLDESNRLNRRAFTFIDQVALSIRYGLPIPRPYGILAAALDMSLWDNEGGREPEPYHD